MIINTENFRRIVGAKIVGFDPYCRYSRQHSIAYVHIPKNASKIIMAVLNDYTDMELEDRLPADVQTEDPECKFIVVLRNPLERWYSGILQYLENIDYREGLKNPKVLRMICDGLDFDVHTQLQIDKVDGLDIERCVFFNADDISFNGKIIDFFKTYLNYEIKLPDKTYRDIEDLNRIRDFMKENPETIEKIKKYYKPDFMLFDTVKFV